MKAVTPAEGDQERGCWSMKLRGKEGEGGGVGVSNGERD
jgi:hypothetical protein